VWWFEKDLEEARARERERDFKGALAVYLAYCDNAGCARCCLALGDYRSALGYAENARGPFTHLLRARAHLGLGHAAEALALCAATSRDPAELYLRGRALLRLQRYVEARDVFDQVIVLDPEHEEAALMRREAIRAMTTVRTVVGDPATKPDAEPEPRSVGAGLVDWFEADDEPLV